VSSETTASPKSFVADSLAVGMLVMLTMTIVQRALGFLRGIWFCRLLDDAVVGQWSLAYDFITIITPVMLLGMPGSLPRYVEHYRNLGHLSAFVRRLLAATVVLGAVFFVSMLLLPNWFGWLVFLEPQNNSLIYSVGVAVLAIIAFNFVYQLVTSLRQVRVVSWMQFIQSVGFTVCGIAWLSQGGEIVGLIYVYVLATIVAIIPGALSLSSGWSGLPKTDAPFEASKMWRRVLPFAISLWIMNLLTNIFSMSDRVMILHWLPDGLGQAAVGQYHSSRIIPVLLMSLATMISGILLPYLAADWEAGRRELVKLRLRQLLFAIATLFTAGAAIALMAAPWLFTEILENRYADGLTLMPMAFVFAIWVSLAVIGQNYLWVAEKGKLVAVAIGVGLLTNVALNWLLLPIWGLFGAVIATTIANGIVLLGIWIAMARHGYSLDSTALCVTLLPISLLLNPVIALALTLLSPMINPQARDWLAEVIEIGRTRLKLRKIVAS
jgi:O-antigen/teichoic acid export membrane protein